MIRFSLKKVVGSHRVPKENRSIRREISVQKTHRGKEHVYRVKKHREGKERHVQNAEAAEVFDDFLLLI